MSDSRPPKTMRDLAPPLLTPVPARPLGERMNEIDIGPEPTLRDVLKKLVHVEDAIDRVTHGVNALASEVRGATATLGEEYGERIAALEKNVTEINETRHLRANGTTPFPG